MNSAMRLIDAMSRRNFLKRTGAGAVALAAAPSLISGPPKYWQVNKVGPFLVSPDSLATAKPYFGQTLGRATKSGIIVNSPGKMFIPNELYQEMAQLDRAYKLGLGKSTKSTDFSAAVNKLSSLENEVESTMVTFNPNYDAEKADQQAKKKAEAEASKKAEAEKARQHREMMHHFHQRHMARRSRMDYAGGSEDVQGTDYTTLEHLSAKQVIEGVVCNGVRAVA